MPAKAPKSSRGLIFLLRPKNYGVFWNYYLGASAGGNLGEKACASFHEEAYQQLQRSPVITQFRLWFRGSGRVAIYNYQPYALAQNKGTDCLPQRKMIGAVPLLAEKVRTLVQAQLRKALKV